MLFPDLCLPYEYSEPFKRIGYLKLNNLPVCPLQYLDIASWESIVKVIKDIIGFCLPFKPRNIFTGVGYLKSAVCGGGGIRNWLETS